MNDMKARLVIFVIGFVFLVGEHDAAKGRRLKIMSPIEEGDETEHLDESTDDNARISDPTSSRQGFDDDMLQKEPKECADVEVTKDGRVQEVSVPCTDGPEARTSDGQLRKRSGNGIVRASSFAARNSKHFLQRTVSQITDIFDKSPKSKEKKSKGGTKSRGDTSAEIKESSKSANRKGQAKLKKTPGTASKDQKAKQDE